MSYPPNPSSWWKNLWPWWHRRPPQPLPPAPPSPNLPPELDFRSNLITLHNKIRVERGLLALQESTLLDNIAEAHSGWMASTGQQDHNEGPVTPGDRATRIGYIWRAIGENIAEGYPTSTAVVTAWMESPPHRANILNPNFKDIGVGKQTDAQGRTYWTVDFGLAAPTVEQGVQRLVCYSGPLKAKHG